MAAVTIANVLANMPPWTNVLPAIIAGLVGGALRLDVEAARGAIGRSLAEPLQRSVEDAAESGHAVVADSPVEV